MSVYDARQRTVTWIATYDTPANITKDDDTTAASIINQYEKPPYPLSRIFYNPKNVDGIRTILKPTTTLLPDWKHEGYAYKENVPINLCCVTKQGITGDKLIWKMEADLRNIFELYPLGSLRLLNRASPRNNDQSLLKLHSVDYELDYKRAVTAYTSDISLSYGMGLLWDFGDPLWIFRDWINNLYDTSDDGLTTTTVDASWGGYGDDYWNGNFIYYVTGDNAGEIRYISDYFDPFVENPSWTHTFVHDAFDNTTSDGDTYHISHEVMASEDGQKLEPSINDGALVVTVASSAGNKVGYITNRTNLALLSSLYTTIAIRYKTTSTAKAKVVLEFSDTTTQTVLDSSSSSTYTIITTTITADKTIDHIRLHADNSTGTVSYDYVAIYKDNFVFPNATKLNINPSSRNVNVGIPSAIALGGQNLGADPATIEIVCDLDIQTSETAGVDGCWKRTGDTDNGDIFLDNLHSQSAYPWQLLVFGNKTMRVSLDEAPIDNEDGTITLRFREYSDTNMANETYAERFYG